MNEEEVLALFRSCSNAGRWGAHDQRGTLNLITPAMRLEALASVRAGDVVSLGARLLPGRSRQDPPSAALAVRDQGTHASDSLTLDIHGYEMTHLDALCHVFVDGTTWGDRSVTEVVLPEGLAFGSVEAAAEGIVTRGVLLDVAATRGVAHLAAGEGISAADLDAAEARLGTRVGPGDAVFVRSGHDLRRASEGEAHSEADPHEGVLPDVVPWLHARDVAVYSSDCVEQRPSGYERVPMPLHQAALARMGLWILDCPDLERLAAACTEHGRSTFALVVAPLRIPGGTGSAVNPLALF
jgi:kynurenine formamidase